MSGNLPPMHRGYKPRKVAARPKMDLPPKAPAGRGAGSHDNAQFVRDHPCPTCGRSGRCVACCCVSPDHRRAWPQRPEVCSLCRHATADLPTEAVAAQVAINRMFDNPTTRAATDLRDDEGGVR